MKDNDYIGIDKWKHFVICLIMSVVCPMMAVGVAIGKEYADKNASGNHWCWWDILADAVGIAIGYAVHIWAMGWHNCVCLF